MKILHRQSHVLVLIVLSCLAFSCSGRFAQARAAHKVERQMAGSSKGGKESFRVRVAKKQQENRQRKIKKNYAKHVENSRKRTFEIQSPEVKERMKQDESNRKLREKIKTKKVKTATRKAGNKYR
jgi:hypothetical protein